MKIEMKQQDEGIILQPSIWCSVFTMEQGWTVGGENWTTWTFVFFPSRYPVSLGFSCNTNGEKSADLFQGK